ncbi:MAG TPA: hypothetical protein VKG79_01215 [Bryobacteraceae bacterium]|nr:hypothetical protein [Bryobacteraceae bacterium]
MAASVCLQYNGRNHCRLSRRSAWTSMTHDGDLAEGTRTGIKVGICLLLAEQILANAYDFYLHKTILPIPMDPRVLAAAYSLFIPVFIYIMAGTMVPEVLKKSAGIRRQAIHIADWWLAFGFWQFVAKTDMAQSALIVLFAIGAVIMALSIKDAVRIEA